jgi:hypothetical protein
MNAQGYLLPSPVRWYLYRNENRSNAFGLKRGSY